MVVESRKLWEKPGFFVGLGRSLSSTGNEDVERRSIASRYN
ncbi:hypothetical protein PN466_05875 [Roseofilum reptotaenium CS-1145]|nr:hypothetical protein [Roseofilum reptotaenium CS-1145]